MLIIGLDKAVHRQIAYFSGDTLFNVLPKHEHNNTDEHYVVRHKIRRVEPAPTETVFW